MNEMVEWDSSSDSNLHLHYLDSDSSSLEWLPMVPKD